MATLAQDDSPLTALINAAPLRGPLLTVPLLCTLTVVTEGIDNYGVSYAGPLLSAEYAITTEQMGFVYSASLIASLAGALILGPLADRFGPRRLILLSSLLVSLPTLLTARAASIGSLSTLRVIIGLGFGAMLPSVNAMVADYAPARCRSLVLLSLNTGVVIGVLIAGLGAAYLIPRFGWRSLLYASGATSLISYALLCGLLPESLHHLRRRPDGAAAVRRLLERLSPGTSSSELDEALRTPRDSAVTARVLPSELLARPRLRLTVSLLLLLICGSIVANFIIFWLPTILLREGADIREAGEIGALSQITAVLMTGLVGWLMDRNGQRRVLFVCYVLSAGLFFLLADCTSQRWVAIGVLSLALALMSVGFSGSLALTAASFPGGMRGTAIGWINGFSRLLGGSFGTIVGGFMIGRHWSSGRISASLGMFMALAGFIILALRRTAAATNAGPTGPRLSSAV